MGSLILDNSVVKDIYCDEIIISNTAQIDIEICYTINGQKGMIQFLNVSNICFDGLNRPMIIHGFEIVDNTNLGWEKCGRYHVRDYEDGLISFYCQDICIPTE